MWYTGITCLLKMKLQITQNKVIRFILGLPSRSHIGPAEFSGANMLPLPLRVDQLKLNHMYSIINGIAPSYLKSEIVITGHHGHGTRSGNRACFVPRVNSFAIKSFFYTGIKQWNYLILECREPYEAKQIGEKVKITPNWTHAKCESVMKDLLQNKFSPGSDLLKNC